MEICAINRSKACAFLDDGTVIYFSVMLDAAGNETGDTAECVVAVAPLPDGDWAVIDLTQYEPVTVH